MLFFLFLFRPQMNECNALPKKLNYEIIKTNASKLLRIYEQIEDIQKNCIENFKEEYKIVI